MRNQCYATQFLVSISWALIDGKRGVAATPAPKGLGPQNPNKKLAHVGVLFGHMLSQNRVPKVSELCWPEIIRSPT